MSEQRKIIAIGDYLKDVDTIELIPVMYNNIESDVEIRIKKPMAEHSHKMMKMLADTFGDDLDKLVKMSEDSDKEELTLMDLPPEKRGTFIKFQWLHSATLISSCCYFPDRQENGEPVLKPRLLWETPELVGSKCPDVLFTQLRARIQGLGLEKTVTEPEAKKLPATP